MPPPGSGGQLERVYYFAVHNPGFLLQLMLRKLFAFFSRREGVWLPARAFLVAVPLLQAAVVMLTVEDWDVRFLAPVLPFIFVLAALGLAKEKERRTIGG